MGRGDAVGMSVLRRATEPDLAWGLILPSPTGLVSTLANADFRNVWGVSTKCRSGG